MDVGGDLRQLLSNFRRIQEEAILKSSQLETLREDGKRKEEELAEALEKLEILEKNCAEKQKMVELIQNMVGVIPEYKKKIKELTEIVNNYEKIIQENMKEISRLKEKHLGDMNLIQEKIDGDRAVDREEERKRAEDMEFFLKQVHEAELESIVKEAEREKHKKEDEKRALEEKLERTTIEHKEEIEMMKVQIAVANRSSSQHKPMNLEIYKKKMEAMKQHYERQLESLAKENDALRAAALWEGTNSGETVMKKKKVSFVMPEAGDFCTETSPTMGGSNVSMEKCRNPPTTPSSSLFHKAANIFSSPRTPAPAVEISDPKPLTGGSPWPQEAASSLTSEPQVQTQPQSPGKFRSLFQPATDKFSNPRISSRSTAWQIPGHEAAGLQPPSSRSAWPQNRAAGPSAGPQPVAQAQNPTAHSFKFSAQARSSSVYGSTDFLRLAARQAMPVGGRGQRSPSIYPPVVETTGGDQNTGTRAEEDIVKDQIAARHQDFIGKQGASMERDFIGEPGAFVGQAMAGEQYSAMEQGSAREEGSARNQNIVGKQDSTREMNLIREQGVTKDQGTSKAILKRKLFSESTGGPRILD